MITSSQIISLLLVGITDCGLCEEVKWCDLVSGSTSPAFLQRTLSSLLHSPLFTLQAAVHLCHNGAPAENGPES